VRKTAVAAQAVLAVLLGLVVLPALFGPASPASGLRPEMLSWLVLGSVLSAWLIILIPSLAGGLGTLLEPLEAAASALPWRLDRGRAHQVATLIVAVGAVLVVQAVLRAPIVALGAALGGAWQIEIIYGASVLVVLMAVLVWLHQRARPLVAAAAWRVLDALVPTVGSGRVRSATVALDALPGSVPTGGGPTLAAQSAIPVDEATARSPGGSWDAETVAQEEPTIAADVPPRSGAVAPLPPESDAARTGHQPE